MATAEQVAAVQAAVARIETATTNEVTQIREVIRLLEEAAANANQPDPLLDAAVATLNTVADNIEGIVPDAPPADPPV